MAIPRPAKYAKIGEVGSIFYEDKLPSGVKELLPKPLAQVEVCDDPYPWRKWYEGAWDKCIDAVNKYYNHTKDKAHYADHPLVALFGYVKDNVFTGNTSTACFADLGRCGKGVEYVLSFLMGYHDNEEERFYLDWLVNRSPWAVVFPEKDIDIIRDNGLIASTDHPSNLVVGGLIASRAYVEKRDSITAFKSLCEAGVAGNMAYVLSLCAYSLDYPKRLHWRKQRDGHSALAQSYMDKHALSNFINGIVECPRPLMHSNSSYYDENTNIFKIWGQGQDSWLQEYLGMNYTYGDKAKSTNPFPKKDAYVGSDPYDLAISKMAELSHKIMQNLNIPREEVDK